MLLVLLKDDVGTPSGCLSACLLPFHLVVVVAAVAVAQAEGGGHGGHARKGRGHVLGHMLHRGLELIDPLGSVGAGAADTADTAVMKEGGDFRLVLL